MDLVTVVEPITSVNGLFALPFRHPINKSHAATLHGTSMV